MPDAFTPAANNMPAHGNDKSGNNGIKHWRRTACKLICSCQLAIDNREASGILLTDRRTLKRSERRGFSNDFTVANDRGALSARTIFNASLH